MCRQGDGRTADAGCRSCLDVVNGAGAAATNKRLVRVASPDEGKLGEEQCILECDAQSESVDVEGSSLVCFGCYNQRAADGQDLWTKVGGAQSRGKGARGR